MAKPAKGSTNGFTGAWPFASEMPVSQGEQRKSLFFIKSHFLPCPPFIKRSSRHGMSEDPPVEIYKELSSQTLSGCCGHWISQMWNWHTYICRLSLKNGVSNGGTVLLEQPYDHLININSSSFQSKNFIGKPNGGLSEYAIPKAGDDEVLIEKTPDYTLGSYNTLKYRAQQMKAKMPNVKLLVFICDPAKRAYSHIKHQTNVCKTIYVSFYVTSYVTNIALQISKKLGRGQSNQSRWRIEKAVRQLESGNPAKAAANYDGHYNIWKVLHSVETIYRSVWTEQNALYRRRWSGHKSDSRISIHRVLPGSTG